MSAFRLPAPEYVCWHESSPQHPIGGSGVRRRQHHHVPFARPRMSIWPEETMPAATASREEFQAWMAGLSMTILARRHRGSLVGHRCRRGDGNAGCARSESDGKCAMWPAWTMGIWFFVGGILNAIQLGTPVRLSVDALGYLPAAYVSQLLRK